MPHTVHARVADHAQAVELIDSLAAAGISREGIRVIESTAPPTTVEPGGESTLAWGAVGAAVGAALGWAALAWTAMPWFAALWGGLIGGYLAARHARRVTVLRTGVHRTLLEIDTTGHSQTSRARRICADHRAWAATGH